jgi:coatomer protein complex subunit alpha (xenin)
VIQITLNLDELLLKKSLFDKNWEKIKYYIDNNTNSKLGNSVISYLHKKNYSGIALNLVSDPKTKFSLAINSGNLE